MLVHTHATLLRCFQIRLLSLYVLLCYLGTGPCAYGDESAKAITTVRLFTDKGEPQKLLDLTISPDGRYVATSAEDVGCTLVDLQKPTEPRRLSAGTFYALAFSADSTKFACLGYYRRSAVFDLKNLSSTPLSVNDAEGLLGFKLQPGGAPVVSELEPESPADVQGNMRIGEELLTCRKGRTATLLKDYGKTLSLINATGAQLEKELAGPPGTWVQLQVHRPATREMRDVALQRVWRSETQRGDIGGSGRSLLITFSNGTFALYATPSGKAHAYLECLNIRRPTATAVSADGRWFAATGKTDRLNDCVLEVFDVQRSQLLHSIRVEKGECHGLDFSENEKQLFFATRDTIETWDIERGSWSEPLVLVPEELRDPGRVVQRHLPIGLAGGMTTTVPDRQYYTPAPLVRFSVSRQGLAAVASQQGAISLWDVREKRYLRDLQDVAQAKRIEVLTFTPDGETLLAYSTGHLIAIPVSNANAP